MHELTGKLVRSIRFTDEGNAVISFEFNERMAALGMADEFFNTEKLSVKIGEYQEKRTLNANAYYWTLLGKLCKAIKVSRPFCHNMMLRRYGVVEEFDGQVIYSVIPDTDKAARQADEADKYHIKPTSQVREGKNGVMYRTYILLKGSHDFTKQEFTTLLEGLIDECKQVGIETATPEELARMMSLYKEKSNEE